MNQHVSRANEGISLNRLGHVGKLINSPMQLDQLLNLIMEVSCELIGGETASLLFMDHSTNELYFNVALGASGTQLKSLRIPLGQGVAGYVAQSGESVIVDDAENDPRILKQADLRSGFRTRNLIATPMRVKDRLVGVLEVVNSTGRDKFTSRDVALLRYLADQAAIAIDNRELFDKLELRNKELKKKLDEVEFLYEVTRQISACDTVDILFETTTAILTRLLNVSRVAICVGDSPKTLVLHSQVGYSSLHNEISWLVKNPLLVDAYTQVKASLYDNSDIETEYLTNFKQLCNRSCIIVPFIYNNLSAGVVVVGDPTTDSHLDAGDLQLLQAAGLQLSESYTKIRLRQRILEEQRILKELETAASLQKRILPGSNIGKSQFKIAGASIPESGVGGDFYDYIDIDDKKCSFVVADVSGKGLAAGLFMALCRSVMRAESRKSISPSQIMAACNDSIHQDSDGGMFVTAFFVLADVHNHLLTYACAGHNEQYLYRARTKEIDILKARGLPLGAFEDTKYEERIIIYEPGDVLFMFTDGVVEAEAPTGELFGEERTLALLKKWAHLEPKAMIDQFLDEIRIFSENQMLADDITLLITKFIE